jgi:aryl-alcohol dehydrogenase-like predicted oxidoreductase
MGRIGIKRRGLASTGFAVSKISLGCVTFGRKINEADSFAILDCAREAGINVLDMAEAYGGGQRPSSVNEFETGASESRQPGRSIDEMRFVL